LTSGSGIRDGRKSASGSGIRYEQPGSYFLELRNHFFAFLGVKILKFFDEDPGSGMETVRIRDGKKSDPGLGINIPDPPHCLYCLCSSTVPVRPNPAAGNDADHQPHGYPHHENLCNNKKKI
jgi:hypothetical protein